MKSPSIRRRQEVRDRLPNFHLWINVCIAGKTMLSFAIPEHHGDKLVQIYADLRFTLYFTVNAIWTVL